MPNSPEDTSFQDRLLALKLLRENILYSDPKTYAYTDIAEDLPGDARAVAPLFKNVLPSAAIISQNPQERDAQIDAAIERIKKTKKSKNQLLSEVKHNLTELVPHAIKGGALFSALIPMLGLRTPWGRNAAGKLRPRLPTDIIANSKKLFTDPSFRKSLAMDALHGGAYGGVYAGIGGAVVPMIAGNYELSDKSLQEAKQILKENPYLTSLPASEMLAALRSKKLERPLTAEERLKNTLTGAAFGLATAIPGAAVPAGMKMLGRTGANLGRMLLSKLPFLKNTGISGVDKFVKRQANRYRGIGRRVKDVGRVQFRKDLPNALAWGGGLGALSGAFSNNVLGDEYEAIRNDKT